MKNIIRILPNFIEEDFQRISRQIIANKQIFVLFAFDWLFKDKGFKGPSNISFRNFMLKG